MPEDERDLSQVKRFLRSVVEPQKVYGPAVTVSFAAGRRPELFSFDENGSQVNKA